MLILIILFPLSKTENNMSVVTLSAGDMQKLSIFLSKWFEKSVYWNEFKSKSENKNSTNEYRYSLESNFVEVNKLFISVCSNQDDNAKRFKIRRYYYQKAK